MENRDDLKRIIEECFEKMSYEKKVDFLEQIEGMAKEKEAEDEDDSVSVAIRDRLVVDVLEFGGPERIGYELAYFLVSMSRVILEITRELSLKQKTKEEVEIDDLREGLSLDNELSAKVGLETVHFLDKIIEVELKDEEHLDERWSYPYRLCVLFNLAKELFHFGDEFLLDTSSFKRYDE